MSGGDFLEGQIAGKIDLTLRVEKDGDQFASTCVELGTVSCGDTVPEAVFNICDAVYVHLSALAENGQVERILDEQGITIQPLNEPEQSPSNEIAMPLRLSTVFGARNAETYMPDPVEWVAKGVNGEPSYISCP